MSGGGKQQTTQTTQIQLPKWVDEASQSNYQKAQEIASRPYNPYTGETVAALPQETLDAINYLKGNIGAAIPGMQAAGGALQGLLGFDPGTVTAGSVTPQKMSETDLAPYLNPYITNVEDRSLDALDRSRQTAVNSNASKAAAAGAFGGSRHGITDAVTNSEAARAAGDLSATLRKEGYDRATELATGDITRDLTGQTTNLQAALQAALANQQAGISGAGIRKGAADSLTNTSTAMQDSIYKDIAGLFGAGSTLESKEQQYLDRDKQQFDEAQGYDTEMLNLLLASLGMSPYGRTETTTKTEPKQGTDWASVGLGGLSLLKGFLSEDTAKTDIEKVGIDPDTGLGVFAYRYKNDPKTYPKVVGVMASDVQKKYPKAVKRMGKGGKRVIDASMIGV
jgi:hypothetical protein